MRVQRWEVNDVLEYEITRQERFVVVVLGFYNSFYVVGVLFPNNYCELIPDWLYALYGETNWRGHLALLRDDSNVHKIGDVPAVGYGVHYIVMPGGETICR